MRILITGSRNWDDLALIEKVLNEIDDKNDSRDVVLVSGNCPVGADLLCEEYAAFLGWKVEKHPADWGRFGKRAGFIRNSEMVNLGADVCLAFIRNNSRGATMTRDLSEKAGISTTTFSYQE